MSFLCLQLVLFADFIPCEWRWCFQLFMIFMVVFCILRSCLHFSSAYFFHGLCPACLLDFSWVLNIYLVCHLITFYIYFCVNLTLLLSHIWTLEGSCKSSLKSCVTTLKSVHCISKGVMKFNFVMKEISFITISFLYDQLFNCTNGLYFPCHPL